MSRNFSASTVSEERNGQSSAPAIQLPDSLKRQVVDFRHQVWRTKLAESVLTSCVMVTGALLSVYLLDRWFDTAPTVRMILLTTAILIWLGIPLAVYRWIWNQRYLEQNARLLRQRDWQIGDQLLSAIELADNRSPQSHSQALCCAAIRQVADAACQRDLRNATPPTWLRPLTVAIATIGLLLIVLGVSYPQALANAAQRFAFPWSSTARFTFAAIEPIPSQQILPHGESSQLQINLLASSHRRPAQAVLSIHGIGEFSAILESESLYQIQLPALTQPVEATLRVGDYWQSIQFQPVIRPELTEVIAQVQLPDYLQRYGKLEQDIRSGKLSAVQGSRAILRAVASRALSSAKVNDSPVRVDDAKFESPQIAVAEPTSEQVLDWRDLHGLSPLAPLPIEITAIDDLPPSIAAHDLPRQNVVLVSEQINFEALASDDFGIKRVGMSWKGLDPSMGALVSQGERVLAAGNSELCSLQTPATFCASTLDIVAQPIELRFWAEDYLPDRQRAYSSPHILYVLTPDQHAIWITDQMSRWHKAAIDVRDKEMVLHQENKRLREVSAEELADASMREAIQRQAALEKANARRLAALTENGESLLKIASKNSEIGVGHLDRWAEMLQVLNDIGNNRMPSVADLLEQSSTAPSLARNSKGPNSRSQTAQADESGASSENGKSKQTGPQVGNQRAVPPADLTAQSEPVSAADALGLPRVTDQESSLAGVDDSTSQAPPKKKRSGSRSTLPTTTIASSASNKEEPSRNDSAEDADESEDSLDEAIIQQEELLAEFQRIADQMNEVLANLEGSTLVKRLKAASRDQDLVASELSGQVSALFGRKKKVTQEQQQGLQWLASAEETHRQTVSYVMDDMQAYFERRRMSQFKAVLDDMVESKILDAITELSQTIPVKQGVSIAQAEFWADNLDRWADDLVDPACSGQCPGCKSSDALPPSMILEALRILEAEVNLREATRVAEQAKSALEPQQHANEAEQLSKTQGDIQQRTDRLVEQIEQLPDGSGRFPKEIKLLNSASRAMQDAVSILSSTDTGAAAIAAETEAIEWLLQSKKINPRGGGGGGTDPGGGGTGTTQESALALMGSGLNAKEKREWRDIQQATGQSQRVLPEEFRQGLDQYFNQLELLP